MGIDKSSSNNSNKTQDMITTTSKKLPPIKGKIPTCTTPQNNCVKPFYKPEVVPCLVRQRQSVASSGAWRLSENFMYKFDQNFADAVLDRVISGSVLELGAGLGCYTTYFHDSGKISSIIGYEGAVNVEPMTENFIHQADLTQKNDFGGYQTYDWVVCMEVAEHIPSEFEPIFLMNIVSPAKKGVLLSWGIPGQNGIGHVNTRTNEYVIDIMNQLEFDFDEEKSNYVRGNSQSQWFKDTTMVFINRMNMD